MYIIEGLYWLSSLTDRKLEPIAKLTGTASGPGRHAALTSGLRKGLRLELKAFSCGTHLDEPGSMLIQ